ncbi:TatD family hydrolase [Methanosphaera sp.]
MIDAHCHLNFPIFDDTRDEIIKNTKPEFKFLIDSGASYESNERSLKLSQDNKNFIKTTMGYHPEYTGKDDKETINKTINQIIDNLDNIQAIGEIGLDFSKERPENELKRQHTVFEKLLTLATEHDMPIVLHVRNAEQHALDIVKKYTEIPNVIFHCFSGTKETAMEAVDYGYYISFATNALFSKKHKKNIKKVPLENMLTETDSPYLSPVKDENNQPLNIRKTIERIERTKNIDFIDIEKQTEQNAKTVYNL